MWSAVDVSVFLPVPRFYQHLWYPAMMEIKLVTPSTPAREIFECQRISSSRDERPDCERNRRPPPREKPTPAAPSSSSTPATAGSRSTWRSATARSSGSSTATMSKCCRRPSGIAASRRCPSWAEMCWVKDLFFGPSEAVIQIHPRAEDYVDDHPGCLHLWRPTREIQHLPPPILVGVGRKTP